MSLEHNLSSLLHRLGQAHLSLSQHMSQRRVEEPDLILENIEQMLPYLPLLQLVTRYYVLPTLNHPFTGDGDDQI